MKTYDRHPDDVDIDLANEAFYERLERMIRAGKGGEAPCWLSADLAIVLYRNVREEEGWCKPATASVPDELDALPIGAVIKGEYQVYEKNTAGNWITPGEDAENWRCSEVVFLNEGGPVFKVIYIPEES
jgi:hypothetical protein